MYPPHRSTTNSLFKKIDSPAPTSISFHSEVKTSFTDKNLGATVPLIKFKAALKKSSNILLVSNNEIKQEVFILKKALMAIGIVTGSKLILNCCLVKFLFEVCGRTACANEDNIRLKVLSSKKVLP